MASSFDSEDRILPLALSLRNNPGVYTAVVGAGLSAGSDIPHAGRVVDLLIDQVAAHEKQAPPKDPWPWYEATHGKPPTYQGLLAELGPSTGERQGILRPYFERKPDDEPPIRHPNDGHLGLATLAQRGLVKYFVTTNFDTLLEDALRQVGSNPVTISTEADWRDNPPIDSLSAVVIHLHGDWMRPDTMRNTVEELTEYPQWLRDLLQRVLEGRGKLIVGWSGKYDPGLREALKSHRTRRYSTFWLDLSQPTEAGRELLVDVAGVVLEGPAAEVLARTVTTLDALNQQASRGVGNLAVDVIRAKRGLADGRRPLEVLDQLGREVDLIAERLDEMSGNDERASSGDTAATRRRDLLDASRAAAALTMTLAAYAPNTEARRWQRQIAYVGQRAEGGGSTVLVEQRRLPGLVLLAAAGLAATSEERWPIVATLLTDMEVELLDGTHKPLAVGPDLNQIADGSTSFTRDRGPFSHVFSLLHAYLADVNREAAVLPGIVFEEAWERWEYLWHLAGFDAKSRPLSVPRLELNRTLNPRGYQPHAKHWLDRVRAEAAETLPFVNSTAEGKFQTWLNHVADSTAWSALPSGQAGVIPSRRFRMDETGDGAIPGKERALWGEFLRT